MGSLLTFVAILIVIFVAFSAATNESVKQLVLLLMWVGLVGIGIVAMIVQFMGWL